MERRRALDLRRVHGRALHLEHVVAATREPEVAVVVERPEVARRVVAVGVEELGARPTADAAHQVRSAELDLTLTPGATTLPLSGSTMRTSMPANGRPQLPCLLAGRSRSRRAPQYGPPDSVMPKRFARAPARGRCAGGSTAARLAGRSDARSAVAKSGCAAMRAAWSGQPRNSVDALALQESDRAARLRRGLGEQRRSREQHREQPAAEAARPEERHRDVEPLAGADAARLEPGRGRAERAPVGVDHALRRAAAARGEQDRPCRRRDGPTSSSASTMRARRGRVRQLAPRSRSRAAPAARGSRWRAPDAIDERRRERARGRRGTSGPGRRAPRSDG